MLNPSAAAITGAVFMGAVALAMAVGNLVIPGYGQAFLDVVASVYPGYNAEATVAQAAIVTVYCAIDGAIAGYLLSSIYNRLAE